MPLMTWTNELSVNIESIDEQHKKLMELINKLHDALQSGLPTDRVSPILSEVIQFTVSHFTFEEKLFLEHGYSKYTEHKKEHDLLLEKVKVLARMLSSEKKVSFDDVTVYLKEWLQKHIRTVDNAYSTFLVAKGVK